MAMAPEGRPLVSHRKNMKFRGRDGKLLSTLVERELQDKEERQVLHSRRTQPIH